MSEQWRKVTKQVGGITLEYEEPMPTEPQGLSQEECERIVATIPTFSKRVALRTELDRLRQENEALQQRVEELEQGHWEFIGKQAGLQP